ncbi:MAG: trehalose-phosphatase [Rubrivivax sp.]
MRPEWPPGAVPALPPRLGGARAAAALDALLRRRPLLAFDFDGTLAPIVARPADAHPPAALSACLAALAARLPVAVLSGRSVADLRTRLGFEPRHLVGSHGADDPSDPEGTARRTRALDPLRARLHTQGVALATAGVVVEDKGASIALHHRRAASGERAQAAIAAALHDAPPGLARFGGKRVVNLVAAGSPDKADALLALVERCDADVALFAGDDVNDEPVFERAPSGWLTLRVGRMPAPTAARWRVDGCAALTRLLAQLLARLEPSRG